MTSPYPTPPFTVPSPSESSFSIPNKHLRIQVNAKFPYLNEDEYGISGTMKMDLEGNEEVKEIEEVKCSSRSLQDFKISGIQRVCTRDMIGFRKANVLWKMFFTFLLPEVIPLNNISRNEILTNWQLDLEELNQMADGMLSVRIN
ncbi:hypothetical protein Tco_0867460 [Tanacetum coccineum]